MKVLLELLEDAQILEEIKMMNIGNFTDGLWSNQGIARQQWYDGLVLEVVTRGLQEPK